jgi:hypothetical protein
MKLNLHLFSLHYRLRGVNRLSVFVLGAVECLCGRREIIRLKKSSLLEKISNIDESSSAWPPTVICFILNWRTYFQAQGGAVIYLNYLLYCQPNKNIISSFFFVCRKPFTIYNNFIINFG